MMGSAMLDQIRELPELELLRVMVCSRQGDRRDGILLRQSRGWFAVAGEGHEALAALAWLLTPLDAIYPYYRDRALMLARGITNYEMALTYFAKPSAPGGGRQMHGHYGSKKLNVFPSATPTASQCLPAAGHAMAFKREDNTNIVICTIGDAALRQGEYYEAVSFAIQEQLPIVFIIEDNGYGISTDTSRMNPYRLGIFDECTFQRVNGRDPDEIFAKGYAAVDRARQGLGPAVLWCELDRLCSHTSSDDHRVYRSAVDISNMVKRDPLETYAALLIHREKITLESWQKLQQDTAVEVEADYQRAEAEPEPAIGKPLGEIYESTLISPPMPWQPMDETVNMVQAVNETLKSAMAADDRVIMMGEDIEDPRGGVFGLTKGLSTSFPGRIINSPLAEATIIGAGVGLAAAGYRPVFEIQFVDFISSGLNQLMTQASTLRWRSNDEWSCPLVLIAPCGAYLPGGGPWHSQTNEGMWAHIHGLIVVEPSTPEDAAGLLWTLLHGDDPALFLLPKHIFRKRLPVRQPFTPIPIGVSALRRGGSDITLVCWGNAVELALEAAEQVQVEGISVEVLDLRSIVPFDRKSVTISLQKTGRLVVLQEDSRTGGFGQCVISEICDHRDSWNTLSARPQLVARADTHVPFSPALEYAVLPDIYKTVAALRETMRS